MTTSRKTVEEALKEIERHTIRVDIPDELWEINDGAEPEGSRLIATMVINRVAHHLEAWEVSTDEDGIQTHEPFDDDLSVLGGLMGIDHPFHTVTIRGRKYIIVITPYC